jgi:hypothetical protein
LGFGLHDYSIGFVGYEMSQDDIEEMRSLIDGCYEIVELFQAESPAQIAWKENWLSKARKFGASGE